MSGILLLDPKLTPHVKISNFQAEEIFSLSNFLGHLDEKRTVATPRMINFVKIWSECALTVFDMGFFEPSVEGGMRPLHHNSVVIVPMIMKCGTVVKFDVFYSGNKKFMMSLLLRHYDVITCILSDL